MKPQNKTTQFATLRCPHSLNARGFTIIEILVATAILAISGLGLGMAIHHLGQSRQKVLLVSQGVGIEASLVAALQDPGTYSSTANAGVLSAMQGGAPITTQPQLTVLLDPSVHPLQFTAGGPAVYVDKDGNQLTGATSPNWTAKIQVSPLTQISSTHYGYTYQIQMNPALYSLPPIGASLVTAPTSDQNAVVIPTQVIAVAGKSSTTGCNSNADLAMMGLDQNKQAICIERARDKCPKYSISKGYHLVLRSTTPTIYSYEFACQSLRNLSCPTVLSLAGNVTDPAIRNPYALQSFVPNTLDPNGSNPGTGTCVFVASATSGQQNLGTWHEGVSVTGTCPAHYSVNTATITCSAAGDDPDPASSVTCPASTPAVSQKPGGASWTYNAATGVLTCQRLVSQVCCIDAPASCAQIWSGSVTLKYSCVIDANVNQTVPANVY